MDSLITETADDCIPPGEYVLSIDSIHLRNTRASGRCLAVTYAVGEGPFQGCWIDDVLLFEHPNPQVRAIAKRKLRELCSTQGIYELTSVEPLQWAQFYFEAEIGLRQSSSGRLENCVRLPRVPAGEHVAVDEF